MLYGSTAGVACGTDLPMTNVTGGTGVRICLKHLMVSCSGSPGDVANLMMVERTTDAGTGGTALTEAAYDPLTVTPTGAAVSGTFSTPPTDSAELFGFAFNQRTIKEIYFNDLEELVSVAASANGIMLNCESSTGTPTLRHTLRWRE